MGSVLFSGGGSKDLFLLLEILSSVCKTETIVLDCFKNLVGPLKRSLKTVRQMPPEVLVEVLSRKLVQFSLMVRDNSSVRLNTNKTQ